MPPTPKEIMRSFLSALLIGTAVLIFGFLFARAAAESSGAFAAVYRVLMAPSMSVATIESKLLGSELSTTAALALGLFLHYTAYFIVVLVARLGYKKLIKKQD